MPNTQAVQTNQEYRNIPIATLVESPINPRKRANLFGSGVLHKRASRIRGIVGVAVAFAAVFWLSMTAYIAVELIALQLDFSVGDDRVKNVMSMGESVTTPVPVISRRVP